MVCHLLLVAMLSDEWPLLAVSGYSRRSDLDKSNSRFARVSSRSKDVDFNKLNDRKRPRAVVGNCVRKTTDPTPTLLLSQPTDAKRPQL